MKQSVIIIAFTISLLGCSKEEKAQPEILFDGSINFTTQQQIDDFGSEGYTKIIGNVIIGDRGAENTSSIINLDGLSNLTSIEENLNILSNESLTSINGLKKLQSVKSIYIFNNSQLTNINGLENVSSNLENLKIEENSELTNINGLKNISVINRNFKLVGNFKLTNLDGLSKLKSVQGEIYIFANGITNLNGLTNLSSAVESLSISYNSKLYSLSGLNNIPSVEKGLFIFDNEHLTNLCNVATIVHQLIEENNNEENLDSDPIRYNIFDNAYNPTKQDFIDGNCNQ